MKNNQESFRSCIALLTVALFAIGSDGSLAADDIYNVGVAKVDITPRYPIRLNGFGFRREESEGITQPIYVKAIAIGSNENDTVILFTIDALGIRESMVNKVAEALNKSKGIRRDNIIATFTHSHTAPKLNGVSDTVFSMPIPPEHQKHIDQYDSEVTHALEKAALDALADRKPSRLEWGVGEVGFAKNRRTPGGPVDHTLPMLVVRSADGDAIRAIYVTYACHCVTLSNNKISGDWAGFAQHAIEVNHQSAIALVSIGCGSDANPDSGVVGENIAVAADQGSQIAREVERLLDGKLKPISGVLSAKLNHIELPLIKAPTRDELQTIAAQESAEGFNARVQLERLDRGESLVTKLDYPLQTLAFGDSLAMVFLGGEVCVDYANRLRGELDPARVWLHGYSNDFCAYIPSERLLKEGGYGGGAEIAYFGLPSTLAPGLEEKIIRAVHEQVPTQFEGKGPRRQAGRQPWPLKDALASIQVSSDLLVEIAAAEPLVADPVAIDFAADGSMWVADMTDYTQFADDEFTQTGSVRLLRDRDGDGQYDDSSIFAVGLRFPTDVKAWGNGVIVCDAPDVIYLEDSDGDRKADVRKVLLTGFATHNAQARVNSLRWGLDNWLYGSCALFGGDITSFVGKRLELGGRDFRFGPDTGKIEAVTGKSQQGRVCDDWGNWYGCESSILIDHYPLNDRYLSRNSHVIPPPSEVFVPADSDPNQLFPIGEPTLYKLSGPPGRPTSVCGLDFYRDELLGKEFQNCAFIAEPVNHLVHRLKISPQGATFEGHRPDGEHDREFLASDDPWFRPVQVRTGLDGCLYVVDMHRAVIEHPKFIPEETLRELDVMGGRDQGRIFRIRPKNIAARKALQLDALNSEDFATAIDSPNGPQRDLVQQILVRKHATEVAPQLEKIARSATRPAARLQALCTLDGLGMLQPNILLASLDDDDASVRRHAIRLSEGFAEKQPEIVNRLVVLVNDSDSQVLLQLACSLGVFGHEATQDALAQLAWIHYQDPYLLAGVWSSVNQSNVGGVVRGIFDLAGGKEVPQKLIDPALRLSVELGKPEDILQIAKAVNAESLEQHATWRLNAAAKLLKLSTSNINVSTARKLVSHELKPLVSAAKELLASGEMNEEQQLAALKVIVASNPKSDDTLEVLEQKLGPQNAPKIQLQAVELMTSIGSPLAGEAVLDNWSAYTPAIRALAFDSIAGNSAWAAILLARLESGGMQVSDLDALQRQRLLSHPDKAVRQIAEHRLLTLPSGSERQKIVESYLKESQLGDAVQGQIKFRAVCSSCHLLGGQGHEVGPDLAALTNRTKPALFESILDPNRAVDERYQSYIALTIHGVAHAGVLSGETSTSVTIAQQEGKSATILRSEIEMLKNSGKSLMPEGLERDLKPQDVADIVAYMMSAGVPPKKISDNSPLAITPDYNGILWLLAKNAEVYGTDITFEMENGNIGYWHDERDHVDWKITLEEDLQYDVYLDWACAAESAGNRIVVEGGNPPIKEVIQSTGGYDRFKIKRIGKVALLSGENRIIIHSDGAMLSQNLMDLRGIYLVPKGVPFSHATLELAPRRKSDAAGKLARLTRNLVRGTSQERKLIPKLWELAIAAGRRNETTEIARLIDVALPQPDQSMTEWQAVVLGGGIVNGISQKGEWPKKRLSEVWNELPDLNERWKKAIEFASLLADDTSVSTGSRYDALRILGTGSFDGQGDQLVRHLQGSDSELQAGAAIGLADIRDSRSTEVLIDNLENLTEDNRQVAVEALLRAEELALDVARALEEGRISQDWLSPRHLEKIAKATKAKNSESSAVDSPEIAN